ARAARAEAKATARQFDDDLSAAHYLLGTRAPDPATVEEGTARCATALARYGLPGDEHWDRRPEVRALPTDEQHRVRARLADACRASNRRRRRAAPPRPPSARNTPADSAHAAWSDCGSAISPARRPTSTSRPS